MTRGQFQYAQEPLSFGACTESSKQKKNFPWSICTPARRSRGGARPRKWTCRQCTRGTARSCSLPGPASPGSKVKLKREYAIGSVSHANEGKEQQESAIEGSPPFEFALPARGWAKASALEFHSRWCPGTRFKKENKVGIRQGKPQFCSA